MYKNFLVKFGILMALIASLFVPHTSGETIMAPTGGGYKDINKSIDAAEDDWNLCWAAAASNLLQWGNHRWSFSDISGNPIKGADNELAYTAIHNSWFSYFQDHWTDQGFDIDLGIRWVFEGINTTPWYRKGLWGLFEYGAQIEKDGGASYPEGTYGLTYFDEPKIETAGLIKNLLNSSPIAIDLFYDKPWSPYNESHVITCYGIEYERVNGNIEYLGIWFVDSDPSPMPRYIILDNGVRLDYAPLLLVGNNWYLAYNDSITATHEITGLTALASATVPSFNIEPIADSNGNILPTFISTVKYGNSITYTATPNTGYEVDYWMIYYHKSGYTSTVQTDGLTYTIPSVTEDMTVYVYFKKTDGGIEPFGDLVVTRPATSPYETGESRVTFNFRAPDGTDHILFHNHLTNESDTFTLSASHTWSKGIDVDPGTNIIDFSAYNASNQVLSSASFSVIRKTNIRTITVGSGDCSWAYYWSKNTTSRYASSELIIGWDDGWEEGVVKFNLPSLPGLTSTNSISSQFKACVREFASYGAGSHNITCAAIYKSWAYDVSSVNWNRRPDTYITGTNSTKDAYLDNPEYGTDKVWMYYDASQAVQYWYSGTPNNGFMLWSEYDMPPFNGGNFDSGKVYDRYFKGADFQLDITYEVETIPPVLNILIPNTNPYYVNNASNNFQISGTASDPGSGVSNISWKNNTTGTNGNSTGTSSWNCTVDLSVGNNNIVITATDGVGNIDTELLIINRAQPDTTPPSKPSNCSTSTAQNAITLSWQNPTDSDFAGIIILRSTSSISATLTQGIAYGVGQTVGNASVIYNGTANSYVDSGLVSGTTYYYALYAYDQLKNYASGVYLIGKPVQLYDLVVDNGSGDGSYIAGHTSSIIADTAPKWQTFKYWSASPSQYQSLLANYASLNTTFSMPAANVTITAIYTNSPDINADNKVDILDFSLLSCKWLWSGCTYSNNWCDKTDLDKSSNVGPEDLTILNKYWMNGINTESNDIVWVKINDSGISGHEGFNGYMSKYETTNAQYCKYLNEAISLDMIKVVNNIVYRKDDTGLTNALFYTSSATPDQESLIEYTNGIFKVRAIDGHDMANHPVTCVTWYGAKAFCEHYGYRLPTLNEWQAVADYDGSYIYGCGTTISQSIANYYFANPLGLSYPFYSSPVGYYPAFGYGLCDMAGNVAEWTNTSLNSRFAQCGGSWYNDPARDTCEIYDTVGYEMPGGIGFNLGFRVCRDNYDIEWIKINDLGVSGHEGFNGYMGKYETTNAQYCKYLNEALASGDITISGNSVLGANGANLGGDFAGSCYYELACPGYTEDGAINGGTARITFNSGLFRVDSGFENHPVSCVYWYGATAFCNYYGWRLPTAWEWQAVADFDGTYIYGCGTTIDNSKANYLGSVHPYGTTEVGAFGTFGYGLADMAGNVYEWTSTPYYDYGSNNRISCGGGWYHFDKSHCLVSYWNIYGNLNHKCPSMGFRVCRDFNLDDGLVAYYPFNGNANDESGHGNNGTVYGATLTSDQFGNLDSAYIFDGDNDYIVVPNSDSFAIEVGITLSYWIKLETSGPYYFPYHIIEKFGSWGCGQRSWDVGFGIQLNAEENASTIWATNLQPEVYYHFVSLFDGSTLKLYKNGELIASDEYQGKLLLVDSDIMIGEYDQGGNYYFDGIIDDIRIYNRALTESEISMLNKMP